MIDYKGRVESYSREMLRKESQIKELQTRMEAGDGCEYLLPVSFPSALFSREILDRNQFLSQILLRFKIENFHAFVNPSNFPAAFQTTDQLILLCA